MRSLHVIPSVAARYGGPSTVIFPMVTALNATNMVRAEIATTDADGPSGRLANGDLPIDLPIHMFRRTWSEQWKVSLGLRSWLRKQAGEYDLIHIHAVWSFATAAAARAAERAGVPYIVRPAGMLSDYTWQRQGWKKQLYWKLVEKRTIQRAAGFHVTSTAEADEVRALRPDARIFVIPNGVDDDAFTVPPISATSHSGNKTVSERGTVPFCSEDSAKLGQSPTVLLRQRCGPAAEGLPIVLFLSRLHPKKGIVDRLLPAVAAMRSKCFLALAGGEDPHAPGYRDDVQRTIDKLGLRERVAMLGPIMPADRWAMFDGADVFVLPSHAENFGVVVGEAMARGCPVVVTDAVQSCEHVRAAGAGKVVSGDVEALAASLDRVVSQPELRRGYGEAGRAYAAEHFRWDQIAERIREMYVECLGGREKNSRAVVR